MRLDFKLYLILSCDKVLLVVAEKTLSRRETTQIKFGLFFGQNFTVDNLCSVSRPIVTILLVHW